MRKRRVRQHALADSARPAAGPRYHSTVRALQFDDLHLFARVAQLGTLSAAARERDAPVSQVSRALVRIEQACGARLVLRSTHGLSLTPEGQTFLAYCLRITSTLDDLEGEFAVHSGEARGLVRVSASTVVAQYRIVPSLAGLRERHPRLSVALEVSDRLVDMTRDGIDLAIRSATHLPDAVVARQIGMLGRALYASPAYARAHGLPHRPEDLHAHARVVNTAVPALNQWPFHGNGGTVIHVAEGTFASNDTNMAATMVLQGLGIGRLATLVGDELVREGRLVPVLAEWVDPQPVPVYAVTIGGRHRLPRVRACIDYWADWFGRAAA